MAALLQRRLQAPLRQLLLASRCSCNCSHLATEQPPARPQQQQRQQQEPLQQQQQPPQQQQCQRPLQHAGSCSWRGAAGWAGGTALPLAAAGAAAGWRPARLTLQPQPQQQQQQQQQQQHRHASTAAEQAKQKQLWRAAEWEFKATTLGPTIEPYTPYVPLWKALREGHTRNPLTYLWRHRFRDSLMMMWVRQKAGTNIPGFNATELEASIGQLHERILRAMQRKEPDLVRDVMSRHMFLRFKAQAERWRKDGWDRIDWDIEQPADVKQYVQLVRARGTKVSAESPYEWLQLTFKITTRQRLAVWQLPQAAAKAAGGARAAAPAPQAQAKLVSGDPERWLDVVDYWVFEHKTKEPLKLGTLRSQPQAVPDARWRLIASLVVSEAG